MVRALSQGMNTTTLRTVRACPCCGEPTFIRDLVGLTDEAAAILGVYEDANVCRGCADPAEAEAAAALAADPA